MAVVSRVYSDGDRTVGFQAKVHKTCGRCGRWWCYCHVKATRYFSSAKHGGDFFAEQLARQWCREVEKENRKRKFHGSVQLRERLRERREIDRHA